MTKQYVALARVSSREQEREGFSLQVQEEALERYAEQKGTVVRVTLPNHFTYGRSTEYVAT